MLESQRRMQILLVEDDPADASLTQRALRESRSAPYLSVVRDGDEAIRFLQQQGPYRTAARPDLILLDLNLPKKDGRMLLAEVKNDPELRHIPIIVLTTSEADEDIWGAYTHHANCYIRKPAESHRFLDMMRSVEDFWLNVARLPSN